LEDYSETIEFTHTQKQRLVELGADDFISMKFKSKEERNRKFEEIVKKVVADTKRNLEIIRRISRRPYLKIIEDEISEKLRKNGFIEVSTPILIRKEALQKMSIDDEHPLMNQIFWVDGNTCLRPMLAPNLYTLWSRLKNIWKPPISIFEVGPCFRRESKGTHHTQEFTMLNIAELSPEKPAEERLVEIAKLVMEVVGVEYELVWEESEVYGESLDVVVNGIEVASGAFGPHKLDENWNITEPWAGIGFGLERLMLACEGGANIARFSRSLTYLDGWRLDIK